MLRRGWTEAGWLLTAGAGAAATYLLLVLLDALELAVESLRQARLYVFRLRNAGTTNERNPR